MTIHKLWWHCLQWTWTLSHHACLTPSGVMAVHKHLLIVWLINHYAKAEHNKTLEQKQNVCNMNLLILQTFRSTSSWSMKTSGIVSCLSSSSFLPGKHKTQLWFAQQHPTMERTALLKHTVIQAISSTKIESSAKSIKFAQGNSEVWRHRMTLSYIHCGA